MLPCAILATTSLLLASSCTRLGGAGALGHLPASSLPRHAPARCCAAPPTPRVTIVEANRTDLRAVVDLTMLVFFGELGDDYGFNNNRATAFYELGIDQEASIRKSLAEPGAKSFKAVVDDSMVGFITCTAAGCVTNMAVDPSQRRQGIGRQLVARVIETSVVPVRLEVDLDNEGALALYKACGFVVTDQKKGSRYDIDWWRGRYVDYCQRVCMGYKYDDAPS